MSNRSQLQERPADTKCIVMQSRCEKLVYCARSKHLMTINRLSLVLLDSCYDRKVPRGPLGDGALDRKAPRTRSRTRLAPVHLFDFAPVTPPLPILAIEKITNHAFTRRHFLESFKEGGTRVPKMLAHIEPNR